MPAFTYPKPVRWIPRENWCIEIDGQRYYGAWTKEDAERVTKF